MGAEDDDEEGGSVMGDKAHDSTTWSYADRLAIQVDCPRCGADGGTNCVDRRFNTRKGERTHTPRPHRERVKKVLREGGEP